MIYKSLMLWLFLFWAGTSIAVLADSAVSTGESSVISDDKQQTRRKGPSSYPKKPRTWTKPYYGHPSASCRAKPGTSYDEFAMPDQSIDTESFMKAYQSDLEATSLQKSEGANVHARAIRPPFDRLPHVNILAAYYFRCPTAGAVSGVSLWGASYWDAEDEVEMVRWHNVDYFVDQEADEDTGYWRKKLEYSWCMPVGHHQCWFTFKAQVSGHANLLANTITMDLITGNLVNFERNPQVFEMCSPIGDPHTVPSRACIIERLDHSKPHYP